MRQMLLIIGVLKRNQVMPSSEKTLVRLALLEKRIGDIERLRRDEQKRSAQIFYSVIITVFTTLGYIVSKVIEKVL